VEFILNNSFLIVHFKLMYAFKSGICLIQTGKCNSIFL